MPSARLWSAQITGRDGARTVALTGELDLTGADELRRLLIAALDDSGVTTVTADLTNVTFLDSAALGVLVHAYQHADDIGQRFFVRNPSHRVRRIFDITGIHDVLNPRSSMEDV